MRKLTKYEWFRARWWAVLLYLVIGIGVVASCWLRVGNFWFCGILTLVVAGFCAWLISCDHLLVEKCPKCGKVLVIVDEVCSHCGTKRR